MSENYTPEAINQAAKDIELCLEAGKNLQKVLQAVNAQFPEALDRAYPEPPTKEESLGQLSPTSRERQIMSDAARTTERCIKSKTKLNPDNVHAL